MAVTEGDKVEAQIKFGWQVNTFPVSELAEQINTVSEEAIDKRFEELLELYHLNTDDEDSVRYQVQVELALRSFLKEKGAKAFSNTFEDLSGMKQLPGLATQHLMGTGYGYGGEGDWKVSAMTRIVKAMSEGLEGGTSFMEDYTYHLEAGNELVLGAHMLEVCPSLASKKAKIEVHPLGIGGKENPARLVFEGASGPGILVSLIDLGTRFRLIVHDVEVVKPIMSMPNLPVARIMWKPMPDLKTGAHAWILAGGSHHSVLSTAATAEMIEDWAEIMGIEFVHITKDTELERLKTRLFLSDLVWRLQ